MLGADIVRSAFTASAKDATLSVDVIIKSSVLPNYYALPAVSTAQLRKGALNCILGSE